MAFKTIRNMKVYEQSVYRYKSTPTIMLKGQWLKELGFEYGTPICVECSSGKLVITKADEIEATFTEIDREPVMCVAEGVSEYGRIISIEFAASEDNHADYSIIPIITTLFPDGVICMESALDYYGYTDRTPAAWHLAVDNKSTRTRFYIDYPILTQYLEEIFAVYYHPLVLREYP